MPKCNFSNVAKPATFLKRDSNTGFSSEICKFFQKTCFEESLLTAVSLPNGFVNGLPEL